MSMNEHLLQYGKIKTNTPFLIDKSALLSAMNEKKAPYQSLFSVHE